jgi:hypothetical protein
MARKSRRTLSARRISANRSKQPEELQTRAFGEKTTVIFVSTVFALHTLGLAFLFLPFAGLFNNQPLIDQDWGLHFHHLRSLDAFWLRDKSLWGYNPFFMAGYPANTIQDLSIKFFEFLAIALSTVVLSPIQWFKICAFLAMASVPWVTFFTARNFFFDDDSKNVTVIAASLLGTFYWWNSLPREMFFYGMIGFPAASYISLWAVSLFYRITWELKPSASLYLCWFIVMAMILPLHVQSLVTILPPVIALIMIQLRQSTLRLWICIAVALALSLAVNSPWLVPAINHRADDVSMSLTEQLQLFVSSDPLTFFKDYFTSKNYWSFRRSALEKGFRLALLVLGALGTYKLIRSDKRRLGLMLACALAMLFLVAYFGALVPFMKAWQPLRFKVPYDLFLATGAAYYVGTWLLSRKTSPTWIAPAVLGCGLLAFLFNLVQTESTGRLRLRSFLIPELSAIVDWIKRETPAEARLLFEESGDESSFAYDRTYLSSFLPHLTGRQMIGGPINLYNDRHHFAEFHSGQLFKKDAQTLSDEQLRNYLRLYNIGAVVAFHPASLKKLQSIPGLVTVDERIGPIHLMKVHQPLTWFLEGTGDVRAGFNRLELANLKGREVILKYHWVEGLTASPPAKIVPVNIADDPIPFIKIVEPPSSLILRVGS